MNFTAFSEAVAIMLKSHPCPQQEKRTEALYEFFGQRDFARVSEAAKLVAKEAERFPTPAVFEEFYRRTGTKIWKQERELCNRCDGFGFVSLPSGTYRGRCEHGSRLSETFLEAPEAYRFSRSLGEMSADVLAEKIVTMDPRVLYRGMLALGSRKSALPFLKRMREMTLEILGNEEAEKIRSAYAKAVLDLRLWNNPKKQRNFDAQGDSH